MEKHVNMIPHPAHSDRNQIDVATNASQIFPQPGLELLCNEVATPLGTEHNMKMVFSKRMSHVPPLPGLAI
jgi:hypothetical protein